MLAQLLRRLLLIQFTLGALLAGYLVANDRLSPWLAWTLPFVLIACVSILITSWTCISSRAREPWGPWWRSLLGECGAGVLIFMLRQPWAVAAPALLPATVKETRVPVVLVHGFVCNHRIWDDTVARLRAQGHAVFAVNLEPLFGSIDRYPGIVEQAVQALLLHTGQTHVALIGHSMGGLAIRAWMRDFGSRNVARVITLGTPHQGTAASIPKPTTNSAQMQWVSDWLKTIAASESLQTRSLMRIAITPQDNIVFPQRSQTLDGIEPVVFSGIGHLQMCTDLAVNNWIAQELATITISAAAPGP